MKRGYIKYILICALAAVMVCAFALAGCSSSGKKVELQIFAANSLEKALPEVQALYTQQNPNVTFADTQFKASGDLVSQLQSGATADVLITASTATMDTANTNGSIDANTRIDMFKNDLVVCAATDSGITVNSLNDLATNDSITSIALGAPNSVPAGKYAVQSLESAGLCTTTTNSDGTLSVTYDSSIANKINDGADKVGTVAQYVSSGQCQVGFVYSSDIYRYDGISSIFTVPADAHKAIKYPGAVCTSSSNADTAADFIDFCMNNADAQKIFSKYGFELAS